MTRTEPRATPTLPPISLTPEQAAAVAVALAARPEGRYAPDGRAALEAVLAALEPDPLRRAALRVHTRQVQEAAARGADAHAVVAEGLATRRVLVLDYRDGAGALTRREVEPQLLARTPEHEYLVAWCRVRSAVRWFRLDRLEGVRLTAEPAPRRAPGDVGAPPAAPHPTHPAGRARRPAAAPAAPTGPRLVLLPGGRQG